METTALPAGEAPGWPLPDSAWHTPMPSLFLGTDGWTDGGGN